MRATRRDVNRFIAIASTGLVIGTPIAYIASTWRPLEPPPRNRELNTEEPEAERTEEPTNRTRGSRRDRSRGAEETPAESP
jgi:hypothetical protein